VAGTVPTHALEPRGHAYAVRRLLGGTAITTTVSYYCQPEGSGCLTIRYALPTLRRSAAVTS
jgi:hypothetical protein